LDLFDEAAEVEGGAAFVVRFEQAAEAAAEEGGFGEIGLATGGG
jgi:hypothetical protein